MRCLLLKNRGAGDQILGLEHAIIALYHGALGDSFQNGQNKSRFGVWLSEALCLVLKTPEQDPLLRGEQTEASGRTCLCIP